jgi:hypothetical protein
MHHQQRTSAAHRSTHSSTRTHAERAHTPPPRTRALTVVGAAAGAGAGAGAGIVGAGCITSHDSIIISDPHITPQRAPATEQWARKAPPATTASTHTDADTHHIGTAGAVGAQGITSRDKNRSTAQPHHARGHDSDGGSRLHRQPGPRQHQLATTITINAYRCGHSPARVREQQQGQSASRTTTTHRLALIAATSQHNRHVPCEGARLQ